MVVVYIKKSNIFAMHKLSSKYNFVLNCNIKRCSSNNSSHKKYTPNFHITLNDFHFPKKLPNVKTIEEPSCQRSTLLLKNKNEEIYVNNNTEKCRINAVNIQMLPGELHKTLFGNNEQPSLNSPSIDECITDLKKFGIWKDGGVVPDVKLKIPKLVGANIEEHFYHIGLQQSEPYKVLLCKLVEKRIPKQPKSWLLQSGWTRYIEGMEPEKVLCPAEDSLIFDVEVCTYMGQAPTLATAVSNVAWYAWISPLLLTETDPVPISHYSPEMLIPLEGQRSDRSKPRIIVGHNISYDRARIKEEYRLEKSSLRFMDTMSMHVCIGGVTSYQRAMLKAKTPLEDTDWRDYAALNSLKEVYKFYCHDELNKETRDIFVEGTLRDVRNRFQEVMEYCAKDVVATHSVLVKMLPMFLERFPHPVTLAGMLELGTAYLPVNLNWERYIADAQQTYDDLEKECKLILTRKGDNACTLLHDNEFKNDLWMWDEDWSTQDLKLTKKKICSSINEHTEEEKDDEEVKLEEQFKYIFDCGQKLPSKIPRLPGYPLWYRKLCEKSNSEDWIPGPHLISTSVKVTPKLLKLTWENYPLHHTREYGWGILVPDLNAQVDDPQVPFEALKELTKKNNDNSLHFNNCDFGDLNELREKVDINNGREDFSGRTRGNFVGKSPWSDHIVDGCCYFLKLPHKDGSSSNVGNPLAKDFIKIFSKNALAGADSDAEKVLTIARKLSYWRNNRERIMNQLVVWHNTNSGAILPSVVVCGTLTRRAMEPTWLTASNAQSERIGSELRSMVQAPKGYHLVGADVDSQELWIAAVIGDAAKARMHGATPFGWMTLSGNKAEGTDMHSVTAAASGISRDHAKVINYARIYGAGVRFAQRLLKQFNPEISETEAKAKANKMFLLTKGRKVYKLKDTFKNQLPSDISDDHSAYSAAKIIKVLGKPMHDVFERPKWVGGTESDMFNRLEEIACSPEPRTPFLSARLSRAVEPRNSYDDSFLTTRVNWVVQSGAVDFLHLMLVSLRWLSNGKMRFCLSFHDEVRYLVPSHLRYEAALALHITNLLTRAFCAHRLGIYDLPQSVSFFSSVEVDTVLRKEARDDCLTPSNPHGLEKGYGIPPGERVDINTAIDKCGGALKLMKPIKIRATKRKHVVSELTQTELRIPTVDQQVVRVLSGRGNNLHEVETSDGQTFLVSMPSKFRRNIWVKRGDFILVEPIKEGDRVKAEMVAPITREYIKYLKAENHWPSEFETPVKDCDNINVLMDNPNRLQVCSEDSDASDSSDG